MTHPEQDRGNSLMGPWGVHVHGVHVHGVPKAATPEIGARDVSREVSVAS